MTQVEVGLRTVLGHVDLAVLERVHGAGVDVQVGIELQESDAQPDFRILTEDRVEIGGGGNRVGKTSGNAYISLTFAAPEFGSSKIYANLGRAAGQDDDNTLAILWNPSD